MKKLITLLMTLFFLVGCTQFQTDVQPLEGVEVREYEGERLDPVHNIRDVSIRGPQDIDINMYTLKVDGLVENQKEYTYDEVLDHKRYSKVVSLNCVEGWSATNLWEGILIKDLIQEANPKPEANTVIFHAKDGYTSSLPLNYIIDNDILLAYKVNNVTLPKKNGYPFTVVAQQKYGYKWVKWVTRIELSDNPDYKGFWESRGWDNQADIPG
jgi:DMSO/TMAO reductase YedYZ molybdopterin-dependent catalytic subunit